MLCYNRDIKLKKDETYMVRSLEEISKGKTVIVLSKEAADLWDKYKKQVPFIINGHEIEKRSVITGRNGIKKADLIGYISTVEGFTANLPVVNNVIDENEDVEAVETKKMQELEQIIDVDSQGIDYSKSEKEKVAIANRLYYSTEANDGFTGLREYQLELCKKNIYFLPAFAILVARTRVIIEDYANSKSREGKAHPGSIQKLRLEIINHLEEIVKSENDKFPSVNDRNLIDTFKDFDDAVRGAFADIGAEKHKLNMERAEAREEDVRAIKAYPFVNWAVEIVNNLPEKDISQIRKLSAKWKEVAIAVMLLTGRRQSEVMSSGIFTYVDESTVIFEGQLKRHDDKLVAPEKIPVLGKAAKGVIDAIEWLEFYGKRTLPKVREVESIQKAAKESHNRCSRYIAETMDTLAVYCSITNGKEWIVEENGKKVNKFKGHLTRQIYAQVCDGLFHDKHETKKRAYISRILLENRAAALSYDRDIEIVDIEELKELCGSLYDN